MPTLVSSPSFVSSQVQINASIQLLGPPNNQAKNNWPEHKLGHHHNEYDPTLLRVEAINLAARVPREPAVKLAQVHHHRNEGEHADRQHTVKPVPAPPPAFMSDECLWVQRHTISLQIPSTARFPECNRSELWVGPAGPLLPTTCLVVPRVQSGLAAAANETAPHGKAGLFALLEPAGKIVQVQSCCSRLEHMGRATMTVACAPDREDSGPCATSCRRA